VLAEIDADLLVVGEIWGDAALYHERVKSLGLNDRVRFVDRYVSNEEAALYFAAADLAVLPYRDATGSAVLQLAFGLGIPAVATRTGGMSEAVEDGGTGFLVAPGDVAGLSRAIVRYFQEDRSAAFRAAIERSRDRFGWSNLAAVITADR
jgi:glycosyltransferase involved in cell wall biosynthesis